MRSFGIAFVLLTMLALSAPLNAVIGLAGPSGTKAASNSIGVLSARIYVDRVSGFIDRTLSIAESYGIEIPENLTTRIEDAENLVEQAYSALDSEKIVEAVKLATHANLVFAPIAIYVCHELGEEEKTQIAVEALGKAVEIREQIVEKTRDLIEKLREASIEVPENATNLVSALDDLLEKAKEAIRSKNLAEARDCIRRFDTIVRVAVVKVNTAAKRYMHGLAATATMLHKLGRTIGAVSHVINETIKLIEDNKTDLAVGILTNTSQKLQTLADTTRKIRDILASKNVDEVFVETINTLYEAVKEAKEYVDTAVSSLGVGDLDTAVSVLSLAMDDIRSAFSRIKELDLPSRIKELVSVVGSVINATSREIVRMAAEAFAKISVGIDRLISRLELLKRLYERGRINKDVVVDEFEKALVFLERLKERLQEKAPQWLLAKADLAIKWVEENEPT